jgi:hypothetical protein
VSDKPGEDLEGQIEDAEAWIRSNFADLHTLLGSVRVSERILDFGHFSPDIPAATRAYSTARFSLRLLRMAADLEMEITISTYPVSETPGT